MNCHPIHLLSLHFYVACLWGYVRDALSNDVRHFLQMMKVKETPKGSLSQPLLHIEVGEDIWLLNLDHLALVCCFVP